MLNKKTGFTRRDIEKKLNISTSTFFRLRKVGKIKPITIPTPPLYQII